MWSIFFMIWGMRVWVGDDVTYVIVVIVVEC